MKPYKAFAKTLLLSYLIVISSFARDTFFHKNVFLYDFYIVQHKNQNHNTLTKVTGKTKKQIKNKLKRNRGKITAIRKRKESHSFFFKLTQIKFRKVIYVDDDDEFALINVFFKKAQNSTYLIFKLPIFLPLR